MYRCNIQVLVDLVDFVSMLDLCDIIDILSHVQVYDAHAAPRKHVENLTELRGGNIEKALSHVQSGGVCSLSVCSCSSFIRCSFWSTQGHSWHMAILQICTNHIHPVLCADTRICKAHMFACLGTEVAPNTFCTVHFALFVY